MITLDRKELAEDLAGTYGCLLAAKGNLDFAIEFDPNEAIKEVAHAEMEKVNDAIKGIEKIAENHNMLDWVQELGDHYYRENN